jgi:hypothetical protein
MEVKRIHGYLKTTLKINCTYDKKKMSYNVSQELLDHVIGNNTWADYLKTEKQPKVVNVSLKSLLSSSSSTSLKWTWSNELCGNQVLLFPHTNNKHAQILHTSSCSSFAVLDKKINKALKNTTFNASLCKTHDYASLKMVIVSGDYMFKIWDVDSQHNYYLYKMSTFNQYTAHGYDHSVKYNVPALVEMDGSFNFLNIVVLDVELIDDKNKLSVLNLLAHKSSNIPLDVVMFNCENPNRSTQSPVGLKTKNKKTANYEASNIIIHSTTPLFLNSDDDQDEDDFTYKESVDMENTTLTTPRVLIQKVDNNNNNN